MHGTFNFLSRLPFVRRSATADDLTRMSDRELRKLGLSRADAEAIARASRAGR